MPITDPERNQIFLPGEDVLYSFWRLDGSLGTVHPGRVVADDGDQLLCWVLAGTPIRTTTAPDGREPREMPLAERFSGPRVPKRATWRGNSTLRLVHEHQWSSVWWFFDQDGSFRNWYVNLEVPMGRDAAGVRRVDGVLDVEVLPDGTWSWKDEDEMPAAMAAGRFERQHVEELRTEGERMIKLAQDGQFPFDGTYCDLAADPGWVLPGLPETLLRD